MRPRLDFEQALFASASAIASLFAHALLLALLLSTEAPADEAPPIVIELRAAKAGPPPAAESTAEPRARASDAVVDESARPPSTAAAPRDYRDLMRRREEAFARDMDARAARAAALERHLVERGEGTAPADESEAVHLCGARAKGAAVVVERERTMARYTGAVPVGLFPRRYLDEVMEVGRASGARLGRMELALPPREVIVQLDEPAGAVLAVGRRDARCLVGFSWSGDVFPLAFRHLPARYVDANDGVVEVLLDVELAADGTFALSVLEGDALGFTRGALYDREAVSRNLRQHAMGARFVRDVLGVLFGG